MKRFILTLSFGLILLFNFSCNYLNVDPYFLDTFSIDTVFARKHFVEGYLWNTASYIMPEAGSHTSTDVYPYFTGSDDAFWTYKRGTFPQNFFSANELDASSGEFKHWNHFYIGIRKANTIMARLDEVQDATAIEKREILGLALFLRGYFYLKLVEQYGPVVITPDQPQSYDLSLDELALPRSTYDECVEYIVDDFMEAAKILPERQIDAYWMRPTKGAALALASRLRLYAASPLFNGNSQFYSNWTTQEGDHFISQTEDNQKWAQAAVAALRVIELGETGLYSLHTKPWKTNSPVLAPNVPTADFPNGAGGIDVYHSYSDMFNSETLMYKNPECIWGDNSESAALHRIVQGTHPLFVYGWNGLNAPQKLIDAYYMRDGSTIDQPKLPEYQYSETGYTEHEENFSNYTLAAGTFNMYANREYRFYATIMFSGAKFYGLSTSGGSAYNNFLVNYAADGNAGSIVGSDPDDRLVTGYTFRKYTHPDDNFFFGSVSDKSFARIRYAEILLNYVEALNELTGSYTIDGYTVARDPELIKKYFNMVRYRAGLPGLSDAEVSDPELLREIIRRERYIEFALEGRRYHDQRRLKKLEEDYEPFEGMNVRAVRAQPDQFFTRVRVNDSNVRRNYDRRLYFFPIPTSDLDKNPNLIQNPGW
ncbi:RagB/SusD family nutrient uptake outer membrane protein [Membranicola marinus]|uniref:RagB/SusD family nutrient uptake outer membrane protein n=1 Tax=Membranihabitans marinus TaxID=1227546 RepID=A0A953LDD8_9BACT|nr:RagB/SusD family nutrient uptake outer membrane protein [Membranihabitans marinus]MBY5958754.1 RagB/SusD family nutrient uptake outer membrane protein [Membranihabitans marinus]